MQIRFININSCIANKGKKVAVISHLWHDFGIESIYVTGIFFGGGRKLEKLGGNT